MTVAGFSNIRYYINWFYNYLLMFVRIDYNSSV